MKGEDIVLQNQKKIGYQFPFSFTVPTNDLGKYTRANPYLINAWKVEAYPKVKKGSTLIGFEPDGRVYTVNFSESKIARSGERSGDFTLSIDRTSDDWTIKLNAFEGGFVETKDFFNNLATEVGYIPFLTYSGKKYPGVVQKNFYFQSRSGRFFGFMKLTLRPFHNDKPIVSLSRDRFCTPRARSTDRPAFVPLRHNIASSSPATQHDLNGSTATIAVYFLLHHSLSLTITKK